MSRVRLPCKEGKLLQLIIQGWKPLDLREEYGIPLAETRALQRSLCQRLQIKSTRKELYRVAIERIA